jgi:general secretion pathway protein A
MYTEHFKLSEIPFNNGPGDGFFTPNESFESAVNRMEQVLLSRDAVAVISGGPGVGKTTIVSTAAGRVGSKAIVAYIDMRLINPDRLYDMLLLKLGGEVGEGNEATSLHRLKMAIGQHNEISGRKVTAVIDLANLTIDRAKRIMQLIHMTGDPDGQLNVVLLGPHALHKLLNAPGLIHIRQRVTYRYRVRPLTVAETETYISAQIEHAGGQPGSVIQHGTPILVFKYVGGVPRLINTLMDAALSYAAEQGEKSVTANTINEVAQLLGWRHLNERKASPAKKIAAAAKIPAPKKTPTPAQPKKEADPFKNLSMSPSEPDSSSQNTSSDDEGTASLMAAALDASPKPSEKPDTKPNSELSLAEKDKQLKDKRLKDKQLKDKELELDRSSIPEMDEIDTSATGMLRLEDLDARFAETIFGEDSKEAVGQEN